MQTPDRIHFYSYLTDVSLELPVGFQPALAEDAGVWYTKYDADENIAAGVSISRIPYGPVPSPQQLIAAMGTLAAETLGAGVETVDDDKISWIELRFPGGLPGRRRPDNGYVAQLLAQDVTMTFAVAESAERLMTISGIARHSLAESYRPAFTRMLASCRFPCLADGEPTRGPATGPSRTFASLTVPELLLSLRTPRGAARVRADNALHLSLPNIAAPAATWTISLREPEKPGEDWFTAFRMDTVHRMPAHITGFELVKRQDFVLSSAADVTAVYYRREGEAASRRSELQAYLWADSHRLYVVDGAVEIAHEDEGFAIFDEMLHSIRLLPPR